MCGAAAPIAYNHSVRGVAAEDADGVVVLGVSAWRCGCAAAAATLRPSLNHAMAHALASSKRRCSTNLAKSSCTIFHLPVCCLTIPFFLTPLLAGGGIGGCALRHGGTTSSIARQRVARSASKIEPRDSCDCDRWLLYQCRRGRQRHTQTRLQHEKALQR